MGARPTGRALPRRGAGRSTVGAPRWRTRYPALAVRAVEASTRALNEYLGRPRVPARTDRGDLAEAMLPIAAALSEITHGDGGAQDVEWILGRLNPGEWPALVTVLASMVDPDALLVDVLGYVTWDANGRPLKDHPDLSGTVRDLSPKWHTPSGVNEAFEAEQIQRARAHYGDNGMDAVEIGRRLGRDPKTVRAWLKGVAA
jgi:hypothetical protein